MDRFSWDIEGTEHSIKLDAVNARELWVKCLLHRDDAIDAARKLESEAEALLAAANIASELALSARWKANAAHKIANSWNVGADRAEAEAQIATERERRMERERRIELATV